MTKAGEEQLYDHQQEAWEKIFSANKSTPRTYEQDESSKSEQEYKPERKKPTRLKFENKPQNNDNIGSEQIQTPGLDCELGSTKEDKPSQNITALQKMGEESAVKMTNSAKKNRHPNFLT